ncbi:MAG: capsid protein [Wigfec virus K19_469]|nr:MAG: capsid protein [Wigfec virus K19_469]
MAYARRYRSRPRRARRVNKRRSKRSFTKSSRYSKRRATMSKKRVLNITSVKKRDVLPSWDNAAGTGGEIGAPEILPGTTRFIFSPTARQRDSAVTTASRNKQSVFMRGYNEKMELVTNNNNSWRWRRICFTVKGYPLNQAFQFTTSGYVRNWQHFTGIDYAVIDDILFRGTRNEDYQDEMVAQTDNRRVTVHYDKTRVLASGNSASYLKQYNHWMPMNKTLVYDDDEDGDEDASSYWSTTAKPGMGDYYILDIFRDVGATSESRLNIRSASTLYWHEK